MAGAPADRAAQAGRLCAEEHVDAIAGVSTSWFEDYLVLDLPPGTGDVQMALARLLPQAEMVVVTTPQLAAQKVAARVADMARRSYLPVVGVIENMSGFTTEDGRHYALFGEGGGRALADEAFRAQLFDDPQQAARDAGFSLTAEQLAALKAMDVQTLAEALDERLIKRVGGGLM